MFVSRKVRSYLLIMVSFVLDMIGVIAIEEYLNGSDLSPFWIGKMRASLQDVENLPRMYES